MTLEQRLERLEKRNKRLTVALTADADADDDGGGAMRGGNDGGSGR